MTRNVLRALALVTVAAGTVVAQEPAKKPPYEFVADFALASSQGNQKVTTVSLGQRYSYAFPTWKFSQNAEAVRGTANGVKNAELYQAGARGDYKLGKKLTTYVATNALRNTPAGLNSQFNESFGLAYQFTDTDIDKFQMSLGLGGLQRSFVGNNPSTSDFVANVDGMYRHMFSKVSYFEQVAGWVPNLSNSTAWTLMTKSSLVAPLSARIGIKVGYLVNYNNAPPFKPAPNATQRFKKFDGLLTTGVQFTY